MHKMQYILHIHGLDGTVDCYMKGEKNKKIELSPHNHQLYISLLPLKTPNMHCYPHMGNNLQTFYYLKNPNYKTMTREEFGEILGKIGENLNSVKFTTETYINLLPEVTNVLDKIVNKLDKLTPNKGWLWYESGKNYLKEKLIKWDIEKKT